MGEFWEPNENGWYIIAGIAVLTFVLIKSKTVLFPQAEIWE